MNPGRGAARIRMKADVLIDERQIKALVAACLETRYPERNRLVVLLASDAGLTPSEIAWLPREAVLTDRGVLGDHIDLLGKPGRRLRARKIPIAVRGRLWNAINSVLTNAPGTPPDPLIISERALDGGGATRDPGSATLERMRPTSITYVFYKLCKIADLPETAAATLARRRFISETARRSRSVPGANLRDVLAMTGQRSLDRLQRLVEADFEAQTRIVGDLLDPARN